MADNGTERDPTQYDPRWQAIEEVHFNWRCIVCGLVALSPGHLEHQHIPGTESVYYDLDNTPWVKCDKCHTHSTCNVQPGSLKMLSEIKDFCAHSSFADNFKCVCVCLYRLI